MPADYPSRALWDPHFNFGKLFKLATVYWTAKLFKFTEVFPTETTLQFSTLPSPPNKFRMRTCMAFSVVEMNIRTTIAWSKMGKKRNWIGGTAVIHVKWIRLLISCTLHTLHFKIITMTIKSEVHMHRKRDVKTFKVWFFEQIYV